MATVTVDGLDQLDEMFSRAAQIPFSVKAKIVDSQSEILARAQREKAQSMLQGEYYEGAVAESITKNQVKQSGERVQQEITFEGMQHGTRIAEIAYVNEYGTSSQPGRPFIRDAEVDSEDEMTETAQNCLDEFVDSL